MTNEESQTAQMHPTDCDCELCRQWWEMKPLRRRRRRDDSMSEVQK